MNKTSRDNKNTFSGWLLEEGRKESTGIVVGSVVFLLLDGAGCKKVRRKMELAPLGCMNIVGRAF